MILLYCLNPDYSRSYLSNMNFGIPKFTKAIFLNQFHPDVFQLQQSLARV